MFCIACILDPRYKMDFVKFCYKRFYGKRFEVVETKLKGLCDEYKKKIEKESNNEVSGFKKLDCGGTLFAAVCRCNRRI